MPGRRPHAISVNSPLQLGVCTRRTSVERPTDRKYVRSTIEKCLKKINWTVSLGKPVSSAAFVGKRHLFNANILITNRVCGQIFSLLTRGRPTVTRQLPSVEMVRTFCARSSLFVIVDARIIYSGVLPRVRDTDVFFDLHRHHPLQTNADFHILRAN